jgi:hypothetical protein
MALRRITYRSSRTPNLTDEAMLRALLHPARERNLRYGVTSCLWCGAQSFVQVLEGEQEVVNRLMVRIATDTRHREPMIIADSEARARIFETWNLKWVRSRDCPDLDRLAAAAAPARSSHQPQAPRAVGEMAAGTGGPSHAPALAVIDALVRAEPTLF